MNERVRELIAQIRELEDELQEELHRKQEHVLYEISNRRVRFEATLREAHRRLRMRLGRWLRESQPRNVASSPFIYGMIVPLAVLDLGLTLYQAVCFPLFRIPKVRRRRYMALDRHQLAYLNGLEKLNCVYCGYANGLLAWGTEIAARTEQYWCPIKHARRVMGTHARYARFLDYGDPADFHAELARLRSELANEAQTAGD